GVSFFVSFWIAVGSIILFVLMVGASASITRAAIMGILVLVAQREGRAYRIANALVFAGAAMVAHNPYILRFDAAFQLSFLATVGLVFLSSPMSQWLDRLRMRAVSFLTGKTDTQGLRKERKSGYNSFHRFILAVQYTLAETLCAQLMVLPLLIWLFGKVSLVSPITNILVLLAVPYAMASGFFAGLLGFIWYPLGSIAGFVAWFLLGYIIYMIELFARLPGAAINIGAWILAPLLFAYGVVGVMWMRRQNQTVIQ
ncbi:MAG: ComEC/Rec2 family competence protein, partial [Candidatus Sungbacteria bacterium]|nr:ComEC/Rec2 family competence protein [Candidatus Sungbacteria bacterium]